MYLGLVSWESICATICNVLIFLVKTFSSAQPVDVNNFLNHVNLVCSLCVCLLIYFCFCYRFESWECHFTTLSYLKVLSFELSIFVGLFWVLKVVMISVFGINRLYVSGFYEYNRTLHGYSSVPWYYEFTENQFTSGSNHVEESLITKISWLNMKCTNANTDTLHWEITFLLSDLYLGSVFKSFLLLAGLWVWSLALWGTFIRLWCEWVELC